MSKVIFLEVVKERDGEKSKDKEVGQAVDPGGWRHGIPLHVRPMRVACG